MIQVFSRILTIIIIFTLPQIRAAIVGFNEIKVFTIDVKLWTAWRTGNRQLVILLPFWFYR